MTSHRGYQGILLGVFLLLFYLSLLDPPYPLHIAVHHITCAAAVLALFTAIIWRPLSNNSFSMLVVFLLLHILGARYIYSNVPYDEWAGGIFGISISEIFGWKRNHYDRMVHFCFGLLLVTPAAEIFRRAFELRRDWALALAVQAVIVTSTLFELGEWQLAMTIAPQWADSYLGQQGDPWDAQKDISLALIGAFTSVLLTVALWNCFGSRQRKSLLKDIAPL